MSELLSSPLAAIHRGLGAKFAEFGGFEMPVEYAGVVAEHQAVRTGVGIFDVSHLGTFLVEGPGAAGYLNTRLANDLNRLTPGQAQYTLLLDVGGGVVDDMIVYLFSDEKVMVVPNAANSAEVIRRLKTSSPEDLVWTDRHTAEAVLAVQGPNSAKVLSAASLPAEIGYMGFVEAGLTLDSQTIAMTVCRTGYTGEHGYELVVAAEVAGLVWEHLINAGASWQIQPCGLGARDTLRTEMGYPLHGQDLSLAISPVEARLNWAVGWKKDRFDGDETVRAQRRQGVGRTLLGIKASSRGIPRAGMTVVDDQGAAIGQVTSGTFSPTLKCGIGLALVPPATAVGDQLLVQVRTRHEPFEVVKPPFVQPHATD